MNVLVLVDVFSLLLLLLLTPGTLELALLAVGHLRPRPDGLGEPQRAIRRLAIVVPAHNEEEHIGECIRSLLANRWQGGRFDVFVVADNCTDGTAAVARRAGAAVLVRDEPEVRGKGPALDFAFDRLLKGPYQAFVVVDADSSVSSEFVGTFARYFSAGHEALQCSYRVTPTGSSCEARLNSLAVNLFNDRIHSRAALGYSVGILGNGFGVSRSVLESVPYSADSIVEDLEYHLQLVTAGVRVQSVAAGAQVRAPMPSSRSDAGSQRARWEGGRLFILRSRAAAIGGRVLRGELSLLETWLDLLLLPLSLHCLLLGLALLLAGGKGLVIALAFTCVLVGYILVGGVRIGCRWPDLLLAARAPAHLIWKLRLLRRIFESSDSEAVWLRTARRIQQ